MRIKTLRNFWKSKSERRAAQIPAGERVYAIGDVHGCADLFAALGSAIDEDDARRGPAETTVILLGDLIDRGPGSAHVIDAAIAWQRHRTVRIIAGNHEEMFLDGLDEPDAFRSFLRIGGRDTILSYPVDAAMFHAADLEEAQQMARDAVPPSHIAFMSAFEDQIRIGDYLFVHAGIRPNRPLDQQRVADLRWIREPFLRCSTDHGCIVVHGHTISSDVVVQPNRIGIDTGAFMSGRLTALGLQGADRWIIETREDGDSIATEMRML